LTRSINQSW